MSLSFFTSEAGGNKPPADTMAQAGESLWAGLEVADPDAELGEPCFMRDFNGVSWGVPLYSACRFMAAVPTDDSPSLARFELKLTDGSNRGATTSTVIFMTS